MYRDSDPSNRRGLVDPAMDHDSCGVGFVAHVHGRASHAIVDMGLRGLRRLEHRGAAGADACTGDGSGILIQIPDRHMRVEADKHGFILPEFGEYGVGMIFLPRSPAERMVCEGLTERALDAEGIDLIGWRDVPTDDRPLGVLAREVQPFIRQLFVARRPGEHALSFERQLYLARRRAEREVRARGIDDFYVSSLSSRTIVYKGRLRADQLAEFYLDLQRPDVESAVSLVHERYSTNTFPTWQLAQPFRMVAHNGEFNTLRGNVNWMRAREPEMVSPVFGDRLSSLMPVIQPGGSDSAIFDNVLEFLVMNGRALPHALMMMVPEAWENHEQMDPAVRGFYEYCSAVIEPWDGPAALMFTDGRVVGATLDRNGLRPARYLLTDDDLVVMASEAGVLDIPENRIVRRGRLEPGRMFLLDLEEGRLRDDDRIKREIAGAHDYAGWLRDSRIELSDLPEPPSVHRPDIPTLRLRQRVFGYTREDLELTLEPMATTGKEPIGSMGDDTPIAALSEQPLNLFTYFRQLFAQVTNPPIDPIREALVMSLTKFIGAEDNLLADAPTGCRQLQIMQPILRNHELEQLRHVAYKTLHATTLDTTFPVLHGPGTLARALESLQESARCAIESGYTVLVLSDRSANAAYAPIPALLAVSAVHHHLVRRGMRSRAGIVVETGEAREVAHHAMLLGYGASAVNPYLAFESIEWLLETGEIDDGIDAECAVRNYIGACEKGLLKILSKMGISTLRSYHGAQIYEALGLDPRFVDEYFEGTPSRIGGIGLTEIERRITERHQRVCRVDDHARDLLGPGGVFRYRHDGERHIFNPRSVANLRAAAQSEDDDVALEAYETFARSVREDARTAATIRGLLRLRPRRPSVPLDEVESAQRIARRFQTAAMSFGALSGAAHETLAVAMNTIGGKSNSGEGGEDPARFLTRPDGTSARSAIKQIASGRFGVTANYLVNADELQIKMAQGAKPGEGGQLPGFKVSEVIARVRHSTPGVTLISPPPHHDIYSIEDLSQLIYDLKTVNPRARISVKLVSEVGVGTVAAGVAKARADAILIAGHSGGTGASPLSSIRYAGIPWEIGLAEAHQVLVENDLRGRVILQTDGKLLTGRDVAIAALLGAEEYGFGTAPLIAIGCVMMRKCHLNTCPVGIATHDPVLEARFRGQPQHVITYLFRVAEELREIMAELGFRTLDEMIGQAECLEPAADDPLYRERRLDFSNIVRKPIVPKRVAIRSQFQQPHTVDQRVDPILIERALPALDRGERIETDLPIRNTDRAVGARLSGMIAERYGEEGLATDSIRCNFTGSAGQSFGAFLAHGVRFELDGEANDYVGKGLCGGRLVIRPSKEARFDPADNVIIGNTALYGATRGDALIYGIAGERFAVRNSGARAVVEGVGDHACEYMTGGVVVVLGRFGRNFAAGMSGGIAYVYDPDRLLADRCNTDLVEIESRLNERDVDTIRDLLTKHRDWAGSATARRILDAWEQHEDAFVRIIPPEYRAILEAGREEQVSAPKRPQQQEAARG